MGDAGHAILSPKDENCLLFDSLPVSLPQNEIPDSLDISTSADAGVKLLQQLDTSCLAEGVVWRDLCALTGTFRTFYGQAQVASTWKRLCQSQKPFAFQAVPGTSEVVRIGKEHSWVLTSYTFSCDGPPKTRCSGFIGLVPDPLTSGWKIWMFTTLLEELVGFPNPDKPRPDEQLGGPPTEQDLLQCLEKQPEYNCVVVGAGFSGLAIAGRLHSMGFKVVTLDKNPSLGDNWKNRYDSARFHTTREYSDFPLGRMFTSQDPVFPGRLDLIRTYKKYVDAHGLDIKCSSRLTHASFDDSDKLWTLEVDQMGKTITMRTQHLAMAIGSLGTVPKMPNLRNREVFQGEVMHSVDYRSAHAWRGKVGVVVGSANTAHDIAEDMVDAGLSSVNLIQRTPTPVFPIEWYKELMDHHYTPNSDIEYADRRTISLPVAVARQIGIAYYKGRMAQDPEKLDILERAGFAIERSGDMVKCAFGEGAGGHHTDVGGGARIIAGQIKVKALATPVEYTSTGLRFADGSYLDSDVIVFCTGYYTNMLPEAIKILGEDMQSRLDDFWGIDGEGELRGAFKRMKQPGIWFTGGGVPWARFGSRFLALQIQADLVGQPLRIHADE